MRRTLASPILAISSNRPSAILADALSASMRTARRGERVSDGITRAPSCDLLTELDYLRLVAQAGRDDRDPEPAFQRLVEDGADDDVGVRVDFLADAGGRL